MPYREGSLVVQLPIPYKVGSLVLQSPMSHRLDSVVMQSPMSCRVNSMAMQSPMPYRLDSLVMQSPIPYRLCSLVMQSPMPYRMCSLVMQSPMPLQDVLTDNAGYWYMIILCMYDFYTPCCFHEYTTHFTPYIVSITRVNQNACYYSERDKTDSNVIIAVEWIKWGTPVISSGIPAIVLLTYHQYKAPILNHGPLITWSLSHCYNIPSMRMCLTKYSPLWQQTRTMCVICAHKGLPNMSS